MSFQNRMDAGCQLAERLLPYQRENPIVLGLPRGGIPVGYEIARRLEAPLDVLVVRKLGAPGREELAIGAIGPGEVVFLNRDVIGMLGVTEQEIRSVMDKERRELARRMREFRGDRPFPDLRGRTVIVTDDGLATGATAMAAVETLKQMSPGRIVLAVPVCARTSLVALRADVDELVCLLAPDDLGAVSLWYADFGQTTDAEVMALLHEAWSLTGGARP